MYNYLDILKWKSPQNWGEREDVMVVEDTEGIYVTVRHATEEGFGEVSHENAEDLKYVGRCTAYDKAEDIFERYRGV